MNDKLAFHVKKITGADLFFIVWGCAMLPLWTLALYQSVKEDVIDFPILIFSSIAVLVSLSWVASPILTRRLAILACILGGILTARNVFLNIQMENSIFTVFGSFFMMLLIFLLPSFLLLRQVEQRTELTTSLWSFQRLITVQLLLIILLIIVIIGTYYLGVLTQF